MAHWKTAFAVVALAAALTVVGAGAAGAAPTNAKNSETIALDCEVLGAVEVTTIGNGIWTPGHVVGSNTVLIPYAFRFEFTPTGGSTEVEEISRRAPRTTQLDVCTFGGADETGSFSGTAWVTYRP